MSRTRAALKIIIHKKKTCYRDDECTVDDDDDDVIGMKMSHSYNVKYGNVNI